MRQANREIERRPSPPCRAKAVAAGVGGGIARQGAAHAVAAAVVWAARAVAVCLVSPSWLVTQVSRAVERVKVITAVTPVRKEEAAAARADAGSGRLDARPVAAAVVGAPPVG